MEMRVEVPRTAPVLLSTRVKLKRIERRRPKLKAVGSSPITRTSFATKGRVSSTEERLSYKQAMRVRLLHPAPVRILYPGIAWLAERAIDNREVVGSTPTPWTISSSGRRQAERHQASILALRGFESHRPLHCRKQKALVRCCPKSALAAQCTFHLRNSNDRKSRCSPTTRSFRSPQFSNIADHGRATP